MTNSNANPTPEVNLGTIAQMNFSMAPFCVLCASVQLGIFSQIAAGKATAPEIASATDASERGVGMLLDALCAFQLLIKQDGRFALHPISQQYLVRESPDYMGYMYETSGALQLWSRLAEVVRSGKPVSPVDRKQQAEEFFPKLVRSLDVMNREPARRLAEVVNAAGEKKAARVLDVACGSGVWGIALAEADPAAIITFQDFPAVLKITADNLNRRKLPGGHDFLPGDLEQLDFGESRYDLAVLGNICHSEGERASRDLFRRLHRALRPGGELAIVETIPNDERTGAVFPIVFALNMLLHTSEGGTFTLREYTAWLKDAGYKNIHTADVGLNSPAIFASKD